MNNLAKRCVAFAAGAVSLYATAAWAVPPNEMDLQKEINELKAQVTQLQAQQGQDQSVVAATIEQVLRDAEKRSALMAAGDSGAGYDNGFYIRSGEFVLKPGVQFQFRNITDYRSNTGGGKDDEIENGFEVRRLKLELGGTAFTKDLSYFVSFQTERDNGELLLENAWVKYMFADAWGFRAGQNKSVGNPHEELVSSKRQLAVDRSIANEMLAGGQQDYIQGASLIYGGQAKENPLNIEVGLHDGVNSDNTNYVGHYPDDPSSYGPTSSPKSHGFDFGFAGRVEYKIMGDWKSYQQFTAHSVKENTLVLGGGFDWNQGGDGNILYGNVDLSYQATMGLNLYGGLLVRYTDEQLSSVVGTGGSAEDYTDWGLVLQSGYMLNPAWEVFGRYSAIFYDHDVTVGSETEDAFHELTVGVNYYLGVNGSAGHRAKVTVDLNWLPNGAPKAISGIGYLGDSGGEDEVVIRGQFQLLL